MARVALVTGGMGGLGESICIKLAALGYKVVTTHSPGNQKAAEWLQTMNNMGYGFKAYPCDVADFDSAKACIEQVTAEIGPVDVLVNNAGITRDMTFKRMTKADWDAVIHTNLDSVFNMTKQVMDGMVERKWGRVINVSSLKVALDHVDAAVRTEILEQLGGEGRARAFFDRFEFRHSYQGAEALKRTVVDRFIPRHGDRTGWLALFHEAIDWAVRTNFPPPHGRVTLDFLRGTVDVRRPRPLEQAFRVPDGYQPPDAEFAARFLRDLETDAAVVLWGSPGQGKSTFLSYVCRELDQRDLPYIRHHYFLDLGDRSDRFTLGSVANSLIAQMEEFANSGAGGDRLAGRAGVGAAAQLLAIGLDVDRKSVV